MTVRTAYLIGLMLMAASMSSTTYGAAYFVSPSGDDANSGDRDAPWQTLEKVSETAEAGDVVTLLAGEYPGQLRPVNSGTAERPIVFRAEPRMEATLTGPENDRAIALQDVSHIRIEGLHVEPQAPGAGWLTVRNCSHIAVDDCCMENCTQSGLAAHIDNCQDISVRNSVFRKQTGGINMFRISQTTRLLFEGNVISRAGHSPLQFHPDHSNSRVVIRGCVFHAAWGRNFEHFGTERILFEHNIVTHAFNSGWSGSSHAKFATTYGIFRFNRLFQNPHGVINLYPFRDVYLDSIRLYNNVFDDNGHYGISANSGHEQTRDLLFLNNIFSRNDEHGVECQIRLSGGTPEQVKLASNVFTGRERGLPVINDYGESFTVETLQDEEMQAEHGARYEDNMDVNPGFVNPDLYDHSLRDDSPLRDAGRFLTSTVGSGTGRLLEVDDTAFFYDGYGIGGEQGDLIAVGTAEQMARVIKVDHDAGTLRVDRELRWSDGDPVSLRWSGESPDIGVYEHGDDGRVAAAVVIEPFEARPGEDVNMHIVLHGDARPEHIRWWPGDGSVAEGPTVTHRYEEEYDYAVTAEVVDTEGRLHRAAGYLRVAEPVDPDAPLVHSTWGPEDDSAWRLWKSYGYPGPSSFRDVVAGGVRHGPNSRRIPADYEMPGSGVNYRHVRAPSDGGGIPARIHPVGWDIDRYPGVFVRYRLGEGTPLVVALKPFARSAVVVAYNPVTRPGLSVLADDVLDDDGEWHELTFDARTIRHRYPDVQVLEGLYFVRASKGAVKEGHWYDLDEVVIGPETHR
ncbi:MAG: right-handed parallel beta-helix repeat-containing protein [Armatimonadota bacterium]